MTRSGLTSLDVWKAIILYGLNNATYKMGLAQTLLQLTSQDKTEVSWIELSQTFFENYLERINNSNLPQQANPSRRTVMERIVNSYNLGEINRYQAIERVGQEAFNDVIPRFHNIWRHANLLNEKFYHFDFGKKLYLRDEIHLINEREQKVLMDEVETRWSLLEGAFKLSHENWDLANDIREIYLSQGSSKRINLTDNIPFLSAYQGNCCFYCGEEIKDSDIHVDHVLPRQFIQHDEVWNLVLSHSLCNLNKDDALVGPHYVAKLIMRNENIMGSNHPWKYKISGALGSNKKARNKSLKNHYENAKIVLNHRYWESSPSYNRENDLFFKRLITNLNNP
ncbi:HNH endonuclease [Robiginitalea aurantiaca]|uniref:HNH endonuclease domain-containing protein n=1 Tax=Robiginitalea aurantiaca TaxID=3056915 RepID=A0ABT7WBC7_9FLAO|nr:HNH endonuclease domain-containing protein [Robiginitalea aurantiaca]MDM9630221.1 HNH endonuclease domain-containing protein [Robiginitalea aurantiaca]